MTPGRVARFSEHDRRATRIVLFVLGLFTFVGAWFLAEYLSENRARHNVLAAVSESTGVVLNGQAMSDSSAVLAALRRITDVPAHHSSPMTPIQLELIAGHRVVAIVLARDSENPTEFWVYRPGWNWLNDPLGQAAGRHISSDLDDLLRRRGL